ncbi:rod shape-determining protein MreD [Paenibacillus shirakamiensis]|uniref:Rod shape-determining protein MreD n=1 Tax=Paenibacillus shirakamiensis TaxID=1265935 RepID=A0ABS4JFA8_9BACL|nr:rod shape-determining protein MreD [Paenibacillus shirakamiensis]MBP2000400.1 rod shape-determining protein MreD [Paenibacillus shirakamiensis]
MARRYIITLLLFILFIIENTIVVLFLPEAWQTRIVPHLVFVVILFASIYDHRHVGLILGICFGLLQDVVFYGAMMGQYSFAMGLSAYLIGLVFRSRRSSMSVMMIAVIVGSLLLDSILFGIYTLFKLTHETYAFNLLDHIVPNMIVQVIFALIIYVPLRRQIEKMATKRTKEETV